MKRGFFNFLQIFLPCAAVIAVLPYRDVYTFSPSAGDSAEKAAVLSIIELDDATELSAFRRAKTGFDAGNPRSGGRAVAGRLKPDLLMRELIVDNAPRDAGVTVEIPGPGIEIVPFELGVYTPSSAAAKPDELPIVKPFKAEPELAFPRAELLALPNLNN